MTRVAWLTDIHLNFLAESRREGFLAQVAGLQPDAVLIGGDIAEAADLVLHLSAIASGLSCPVYFVLGNHDFYFGSIRQVRAEAQAFCDRTPNMHWLGGGEVFELSASVGLVGHDGWADGRLGDYERSVVLMNDHRLIQELASLDKRARWEVLKELGDEAAAHVRRVLPLALKTYSHVFLLTHVPPFREACWYQGQISNDQWLPHFSSLAMGQAILQIMRAHPDCRLTVLCGHTHSSGETSPLPNVRVLTGGAEYGEPAVQQVFEL